jgi:hypothetical protein
MMTLLDKPVIYGVFADDVLSVWDRIAPLLEKAIHYSDGKYNLEKIKEGVLARILQVWVAERTNTITTCMVTEIKNYPTDTRLTVVFYAGESVKEYMHFKEVLYQWAREHGCSSVELYGRPGWERVLKEDNFEKIHTVLRRKL